MACMCGDPYCPSCGPAQGNSRCPICGEWFADGGCANPEACEAAYADYEERMYHELKEAEELAATLEPKTTLHLRREPQIGDDVFFLIKGNYVKAKNNNDVDLLYASVKPGECWWEKELPPCPDCGGKVVWAEAGYVPGTRQCEDCKSLFHVHTED